MNILVIEDDAVTLKTLQGGIQNLGHNVAIAANGEEAIKAVENQKFDLIISDIMMPGISGLSLVSVLRTVELCNAPIIMMSALNNKSLVDAALKAGANDFIAKPFTIEEIKNKLRQYDTSASSPE